MPSEEYLIEWIHRFIAATTGALIVGTMIATWINRDANRKIRFTSSFSSALVVTQITLGAIVIDTIDRGRDAWLNAIFGGQLTVADG